MHQEISISNYSSSDESSFAITNYRKRDFKRLKIEKSNKVTIIIDKSIILEKEEKTTIDKVKNLIYY